MGIKIFLSPSSQQNNHYAVGNTNEKEQMEALAGYVKALLDREYLCETVIASPGLSINAEGRTREAKENRCDIYLALHSNAGGGGKATGAMAFYHPNSSTSKLLAANIVKELTSICPVRSNRSTSLENGMQAFGGAGLVEVREPTKQGLIAVLAETDFHDSILTARWISENKQTIAGAYVKALVSTLNIKKKPVELNDLVQEKIGKQYSVQVGSFSKKENAEKLLEQLKQAGFKGYLQEEDANV